jgi:hypothetical protein
VQSSYLQPGGVLPRVMLLEAAVLRETVVAAPQVPLAWIVTWLRATQLLPVMSPFTLTVYWTSLG